MPRPVLRRLSLFDEACRQEPIAPSLAAHVAAARSVIAAGRDEDEASFRIPLPIPATVPFRTANATAIHLLQPPLLARLTHLVLSAATARAFRIDDLLIGRWTQIDPGVPWPNDLSAFSVARAPEGPTDAVRLETRDAVRPTQLIALHTRLKEDATVPQTFEGILWIQPVDFPGEPRNAT
jgi:hypothetical protein